jgi:hypothetical protein
MKGTLRDALPRTGPGTGAGVTISQSQSINSRLTKRGRSYRGVSLGKFLIFRVRILRMELTHYLN